MCSPRKFSEHNSKNISDRLQMTNPNRWNPSTSWVMHVDAKLWKFQIHLLRGQVVKVMNFLISYFISCFIYSFFIISLTAWPCSKWIRNFQNFACTCITYEVHGFQRFGFVIWSRSNVFLELCSPNSLGEHVTP